MPHRSVPGVGLPGLTRGRRRGLGHRAVDRSRREPAPLCTFERGEHAMTRVYELAKEFGVESKVILDRLSSLGEFVRSASSVVAPPVERQIRAAMDEQGPTSLDSSQHLGRQSMRRPGSTGAGSRSLTPAPELTLEQEAAVRRRRAQRGKRYRGQIDPATMQYLDRCGADLPPFIDEYERALAETNRWTALGWIAPEDIVRWRDECPGIDAEAGMVFHLAGVSPRLARTLWNGVALDDDGPNMLYESCSRVGPPYTPPLTAEDACWLLRQKGLLAG